jgi:hypothetical protein
MAVLEKDSMAGRGTSDDGHDGDAGFAYVNTGYYLDGSTSCDPVVGSAQGGAGGAGGGTGGGAYFEAVGPNSSAMDTATGGAGGTSGGAGGGSYIRGGYGGAGALIADYGGTGRPGTSNS